MSAWKSIPKNQKIDAADSMILIRKPNGRGGYNLELAYKTVSDTWRLAGHGTTPIDQYKEWADIPK